MTTMAIERPRCPLGADPPLRQGWPGQLAWFRVGVGGAILIAHLSASGSIAADDPPTTKIEVRTSGEWRGLPNIPGTMAPSPAAILASKGISALLETELATGPVTLSVAADGTIKKSSSAVLTVGSSLGEALLAQVLKPKKEVKIVMNVSGATSLMGISTGAAPVFAKTLASLSLALSQQAPVGADYVLFEFLYAAGQPQWRYRNDELGRELATAGLARTEEFGRCMRALWYLPLDNVGQCGADLALSRGQRNP